MPDYSTRDPRGWCGDPSRGAAMGRGTWEGPKDYQGKIYLRRIRLNNGGYDSNGTYFGHGEPLYWYASEDGEIDGMLRARPTGYGINVRIRPTARLCARDQVLFMYPQAKVRR